MSGTRNMAEEDRTVILEMLNQIERDSRVTQRHLSRELGIALGLTNTYLKRCVKKGYVKIRQVPLNRYAYYLTPRGFAEKSRLTSEYLVSSFDFFRRARRDCAAVLELCRARGWRHVVLWGSGDLAEIAVLSATEAEITIIGIVDPALGQRHCAGLAVVADLTNVSGSAGAPNVQAIVVIDVRAPSESFKAAQSAAAQHGLPLESVVAPDLLAITPDQSHGKP
jgi:DNA-binding MarR family transcriptional regulator